MTRISVFLLASLPVIVGLQACADVAVKPGQQEAYVPPVTRTGSYVPRKGSDDNSGVRLLDPEDVAAQLRNQQPAPSKN